MKDYMGFEEMMEYTDELVEMNGYEDSPAYEVIYCKCCIGRNKEDAKEVIEELLNQYK